MKSNLYFIFLALFYFTTALTVKNSLAQDKMYILNGEDAFKLNLIEDAITTELISLMPLKTKIFEEDSTSKHMLLNTKIDTENLIEASPIRANKGDLLLFNGNELILLNEDTIITNVNGDYIKIGSIYEDEKEKLLSSISKNKTIFLWNTLNYENHKEKVKPYGFYNSLLNFFTWKIFTLLCFILI